MIGLHYINTRQATTEDAATAGQDGNPEQGIRWSTGTPRSLQYFPIRCKVNDIRHRVH
jgi:hypothetical protein